MKYLQIRLSGKAGQNKFAKVSKEDYALLMNFTWGLNRNGYAVSKIKGKEVRMHRFVLNVTDPDVIVDHKDRDRLNNQRDNLRQFTPTQNSNNRTSSRFIIAFGERKTIGEWAVDPRCGCNYNVLIKRLDREIHPECAILASGDREES